MLLQAPVFVIQKKISVLFEWSPGECVATLSERHRVLIEMLQPAKVVSDAVHNRIIAADDF